MENFLTKFVNADTNVQSSNAVLSVSTEFGGTIDISKGVLKMNINFYARLYKTRYENIISLDDWDVNDRTDIVFNGLPVDDLNALRQSMMNSGLSTLASGTVIEDNDIKKEIALQVSQSSIFKSVYGKKAIMMDTLSEDDKKKIYLNFAIANYHNKSFIKSELKMFSVNNEEGDSVDPSYEQLIDMYNELNK